MKKEKLFSILILPSMWLIYIIFEIVSGNLNNSKVLVFNLLLLIPLLIIGLSFYTLSKKSTSGLPTKKLLSITALLILADQIIKLIIKLFFFNKRFYIIPEVLSFNPIINTSGSWLNVRFKANISFSILIFINFLALFIFLELYKYFKMKNIKDFYGDCCFAFIFSGSFCSLVDKIFYNGSLDFIGIGSLFIADLKDIFINIAIFLFILTCYKNGFFEDNNNSTFKEDISTIKDFFSFIYNDIKKIIFIKKN